MIVDDSALLHGRRPYDAAKAHEYYLRTRKLKGRQHAQQKPPAGNHRSSHQAPSKASRAKMQKDADQQVAALKARLERLKSILAQLVERAKSRSGVSPKSSSSTSSKSKSSSSSSSSSSKSGGGSKRELTTQQKHEAAKRSKEWREKHKQDLPKPNSEIEHLKAQIADIREQIRKAIEDARPKSTTKSQPKTASKGR